MRRLAAFFTCLVTLLVAPPTQAAPFAYITRFTNGTVSVIDTSNNSVGTTVTVGSNPFGAAVNPTGSRVYVTNNGSNSVSVIDTSNNTVTATVMVGSNPEGVTVNPAGTRAYVANHGSQSVSVIDTSTNAVIATVTVGNSTHGVAVNPAGTRVYVANGANTVSVIDTSNNTVIATVPVGSDAFAAAVNPTGSRVYVGNNGSNNVSVIDTTNNTVIATVLVGNSPKGVAMNLTGTRVYVVNNNGSSVSVIDTTNNAVIATVLVGNSPEGVAMNPSGTAMYVTSYTVGAVYVIDTTSNTVSNTVSLGGFGLYSVGQFMKPAFANPELGVNPVSKNFGSVSVNVPSTQVFTLSNKGSNVLSIATLTGNTAMFVIDAGDGAGGTCGNLPAAIGIGGSCTISVTFTPTSTGAQSTNLQISSDDPATPTKTIALSGSGVGPALGVNPASKNFGSVTVNAPSSQVVTLSNTGTASLSVTNIATATGNTGMFAIAVGNGAGGTCGNLPATIGVGNSCTITVTFTPTSGGALSTNLQITSSDPASPTSIALSGIGAAVVIQSIPTLSEWGFIIMGCMLAGAGLLAIRRNTVTMSPS